MASLRVRIILPGGFDVENNLPKLKRTLSAQKGIDVEGNGNGYVLVVKDGTELRALKGAKTTLEQYGIRLAAATFNQETEEDFFDDGSPLPEYCDDPDCAQCAPIRAMAERRRNAQRHAQEQQRAMDAVLAAQAQEQSTRQREHDRQLKKLLEEAVTAMRASKRRI